MAGVEEQCGVRAAPVVGDAHAVLAVHRVDLALRGRRCEEGGREEL